MYVCVGGGQFTFFFPLLHSHSHPQEMKINEIMKNKTCVQTK